MDLQKLHDPIEKQLALLGFELVCLEAAREGRDEILRLFIDHLDHAKGGITLDDCVAANDGLVMWMDVTFPSLREDVGIEISSPGLERPLIKPDHYRRFMGHLCKLQTRIPLPSGQKRFKGWIQAVGETDVTLEEDGTLKVIPFEAIQKARLAPFDEEGAPPPKHVQREGAQPSRPAKGSSSRKGESPKAKPKRAAEAADEHVSAETSADKEA